MAIGGGDVDALVDHSILWSFIRGIRLDQGDLSAFASVIEGVEKSGGSTYRCAYVGGASSAGFAATSSGCDNANHGAG